MWFKTLMFYRSVHELRDVNKYNKISKPIKSLRASVKIAVVDDQKFAPFSNLTSYGYNITELPDVRSISELSGYDVVLCDLMGVGHYFDKSIGGASIIAEIKRNYPTKFVVAYSGARSNAVEAVAAREFADDFIKKDAEISKWVERLDEIIEDVVDPYQIWIAARGGLIAADVDIRRVVELEDAYVSSIKSGDGEFGKIKNVLSRADLGENAKSILNGLIASAIFKMMVG